MRVGTALAVAVTVLATATGTAVAMENTAPFAEAGLDQTVQPNTTVYLDANGSADPDGELAAVEWQIRTPDGDARSPDCADCRRTRFTATTVGRYTVTLSVTDDDGASSSDRLYVTVTNDAGPTVSVSGPATATTDSETTLTADVSRTEGDLQTLAWLVNDSVVDRQGISGDSATVELTHSFEAAGARSVSAIVYDSLGERGSASHTVVVAPTPDAGSGESSDSLCYEPSGLCGDGADFIYTIDGTTTVVDSNGKEGIQLASGGDGIKNYGNNLASVDTVENNEGGGIRVSKGQLGEVTTEQRQVGYEENKEALADDEGSSGDNSGSSDGSSGSNSIKEEGTESNSSSKSSGRSSENKDDTGSSKSKSSSKSTSNTGSSGESSDGHRGRVGQRPVRRRRGCP